MNGARLAVRSSRSAGEVVDGGAAAWSVASVMRLLTSDEGIIPRAASRRAPSDRPGGGPAWA
ncbi:hypothetical protein GCM10027054_23540 [Isoptericola nanjingensis]